MKDMQRIREEEFLTWNLSIDKDLVTAFPLPMYAFPDSESMYSLGITSSSHIHPSMSTPGATCTLPRQKSTRKLKPQIITYSNPFAPSSRGVTHASNLYIPKTAIIQVYSRVISRY